MQRHNSEQLGDVLRQWLRQQGLETPLLQHRLVASWPEVMGETVARYTGKVEIRGGKLYVQLRNAALRANLAMMHTNIAERLNTNVGAQIIQDVRFC